MTNNSLSKIPYWDGKAESFNLYVSKIKAYAKFKGIGDALNPVLMANCPIKLEFAVIDITNPTNIPFVELTRQTRSFLLSLHWVRTRVMELLCWGRQRMMTIPMG